MSVTTRLDDARFKTPKLDRVGAVLAVTIDNPRSAVNAVDAEMHDEIIDLIRGLRLERDARAVVLQGSKQAFSAGGDPDFVARDVTKLPREHTRIATKQMLWDFVDLELPVVAAINGQARGLLGSLALLSDAVFMARTATIADFHVLQGVAAGDGGTAIWPLLVGPALAKRYLLTGDPVNAAEALRIGLATHVVADDQLHEEAMAFATRLAAGASLAVRYTKLAINKLVKDALNMALRRRTRLRDRGVLQRRLPRDRHGRTGKPRTPVPRGLSGPADSGGTYELVRHGCVGRRRRPSRADARR